MTDRQSLEHGTSVTPTLHDEPLDTATEKGATEGSLPTSPSEVTNRIDSAKTHEDVLIVDWDGPDDPQNPKK